MHYLGTDARKAVHLQLIADIIEVPSSVEHAPYIEMLLLILQLTAETRSPSSQPQIPHSAPKCRVLARRIINRIQG